VSSTVRWILLAVLGLAVALGVAVAGSNLASKQIGLASEPLNAGKALAPPERSKGRGENAGERRSRRVGGEDSAPPAAASTATTPTTTATPSAPQAPTESGGPSPVAGSGDGSAGESAGAGEADD
jgi:hypothetical protein